MVMLINTFNITLNAIWINQILLCVLIIYNVPCDVAILCVFSCNIIDNIIQMKSTSLNAIM
jgi:hypothetical protein